MGFYDRHILPFMLDMAMGAKPIRYQRRKVVPQAEGRVLEVGFGTGYNLAYYDPNKVTHLWALEPAREVRERAAKRLEANTIPIEFLDLPGERIPLADDSADTVLITYTMCSIPDVRAALAQMRRVLKPSGRMLFCEHGKAPDATVERWQHRIEPVWKTIAGGCHLARPIPALIAEAGFKIAAIDTMYLPGTPRFAGFNYWGSATKG